MAKKLTIKTVSGTTTVIVPSKQDVSEQIKEAVIDAFIDVDYNPNTGVLTFEQQGGGSKSIDLPLELIVESGYYDSETQELVLILANGQEIRIPIGDLLTDLDAHNIRFNGSGTNYLTDKTEVEGALKELDKVINEIDYINVQNQDTSEMQKLRLYVVGGQIGYEMEGE